MHYSNSVFALVLSLVSVSTAAVVAPGGQTTIAFGSSKLATPPYHFTSKTNPIPKAPTVSAHPPTPTAPPSPSNPAQPPTHPPPNSGPSPPEPPPRAPSKSTPTNVLTSRTVSTLPGQNCKSGRARRGIRIRCLMLRIMRIRGLFRGVGRGSVWI